MTYLILPLQLESLNPRPIKIHFYIDLKEIDSEYRAI